MFLYSIRMHYSFFSSEKCVAWHSTHREPLSGSSTFIRAGVIDLTFQGQFLALDATMHLRTMTRPSAFCVQDGGRRQYPTHPQQKPNANFKLDFRRDLLCPSHHHIARSIIGACHQLYNDNMLIHSSVWRYFRYLVFICGAIRIRRMSYKLRAKPRPQLD
jgi:hypothetical protein